MTNPTEVFKTPIFMLTLFRKDFTERSNYALFHSFQEAEHCVLTSEDIWDCLYDHALITMVTPYTFRNTQEWWYKLEGDTSVSKIEKPEKFKSTLNFWH